MAATAISEITRSQYMMTAQLDYALHQLTVSEKIRYTNPSTDPLSTLELMVEANQTNGVFQLISLTWADGTAVQNYTLQGERLDLHLTQALAAGQTIEIDLSYTLNLPAAKGLLSFGGRQINLVGWYPYLPAYLSGKGWLLHAAGAVGEYEAYESADFDVSLTITGAPANLVVAASAANDSVSGYHYSLTDARNFTLSASTEYKQLGAFAGDTIVNAYVFDSDAEAGQASLEATVKAVTLYSRLFAPYPHRTLSVVEADFSDGMEEDGLYFLGSEYFKAYRGDPASYLVALSAHETAHQWWFGLVGNDQAQEPWLDEALATYSERLFYENEYPALVDWWQQTRVQVYSPQGWVNSSIYDFSAFRPYVNAVYLRGAEFFEDLRQLMGDQAFFAFLPGYIASVREQNQALSDANQFWSILQQYTSADLSGLKSEYFK
jgi:hypothetical protein